MPNSSMNTPMTISKYGLLYAPTLSALLLKPPVPAVPKVWMSESNSGMPPAQSRTTSMKVMAK